MGNRKTIDDPATEIAAALREVFKRFRAQGYSQFDLMAGLFEVWVDFDDLTALQHRQAMQMSKPEGSA